MHGLSGAARSRAAVYAREGGVTELITAIETTRINPHGALPEPLPIMEVASALTRADGYTDNETDKTEMERQWPQPGASS